MIKLVLEQHSSQPVDYSTSLRAFSWINQFWLGKMVTTFSNFKPSDCKDAHTENMREVKKILSDICQQDEEKFQGKNSFLCEICEIFVRDFTFKGNLRRHMNNRHTKRVQRFVCRICKNYFFKKMGFNGPHGKLSQHVTRMVNICNRMLRAVTYCNKM